MTPLHLTLAGAGVTAVAAALALALAGRARLAILLATIGAVAGSSVGLRAAVAALARRWKLVSTQAALLGQLGATGAGDYLAP